MIENFDNWFNYNQKKLNEFFILRLVFYEHKISSLTSIFVVWILASFDTWQRKVWLWSAGVSKSVKIDELEKNVESVWLPIELTKEAFDQKKKKKE